ncbi:uncharacterized protein LOC123301616 [Chrysoperla carnea]|uniref:uncharacterized protein LOC123301616 n=1 Tax=Chrysoperla carnea TaxID=189513 RepID=UPI001D064398|nr:uncharacterized protein LOC123301616 [Chrysoperla carnea]
MKFIVLTLAFVCLAQYVFGEETDTANIEPDTTKFDTEVDTLSNNLVVALSASTNSISGEDAAAVQKLKETSIKQHGIITAFLVKKLLKKAYKLFKKKFFKNKSATKIFKEKVKDILTKFKSNVPASGPEVKQQLSEAVQQIINESDNLEKELDGNSNIDDEMDKLAKESFSEAAAEIKRLQQPKSP